MTALFAVEIESGLYLTGTFTAYRARFYVGFLSCIVDDYFVFFYDSAIIFHRFCSDASSYYKVVVFIVPLQGLYDILLEDTVDWCNVPAT